MTTNKLFSKNFLLALGLSAVMPAMAGITACSISTGTNPNQGTEAVMESRGEHGNSGEGGEGGSEEGSGVNALALNQIYDVTNYGARMVMNYAAASNSFIGTVENTTNATLSQVRVEVHLSNGTELGPTIPVDLASGAVIEVNLPATAAAFDSWTPHAEVGGSEHGAAGEGSESGSESGGEGGSEGTGGEGHGPSGEGGSESGLEILMSSPITPISQSWSGNLGGLDVTGSYDANAKSLTSVVTNTLSEELCYVQTEPHLKMGKNTVAEMGPDMVGDLNPGETKTSVLYLADEPGLAGVQFDGFVMHMEVFACSGLGPDEGAPTINPLTGQPGSGSEGSNEGTGGEGHGAGGEGGSESGGEHGSGGEGSDSSGESGSEGGNESGGEGGGEHGSGSEGGEGGGG